MRFRELQEPKKNTFIKDLFLFSFIFLLISITLSFFATINFFLVAIALLAIFMLIRTPVFYWKLVEIFTPHTFFSSVPKKNQSVPLFFRPYSALTSFINTNSTRLYQEPHWFSIFLISYENQHAITSYNLSIRKSIMMLELAQKTNIFFISFFFYHITAAALLSISLSITFVISTKTFLSTATILGIIFLMLIIIYWIVITLFVQNYTQPFKIHLNNLQQFGIETFTEESVEKIDDIVLIAKSSNNQIEKLLLSDIIKSVEKIESDFLKIKDTIIQMSAPIIFVALTAIIIAIIKNI